MLAKYGPEETLNKLYRLIPKQIVSKYPRHHDSWYTEKSLINRIKKFGFSEVYRIKIFTIKMSRNAR